MLSYMYNSQRKSFINAIIYLIRLYRHALIDDFYYHAKGHNGIFKRLDASRHLQEPLSLAKAAHRLLALVISSIYLYNYHTAYRVMSDYQMSLNTPFFISARFSMESITR